MVATMQIFGIKETLAELNKFDRTYRRQITKDIKNAGQVIVAEARSMVPTDERQLSGVLVGNLIKTFASHWDNASVKAGFQIKVGKAATRERTVRFKDKTVNFKATPYQLMVMQQKDAAGAIYDHAGKRTQTQFVTNLNKEVGEQPRIIDKATEMHKDTVANEVEKILEKVYKTLNKKLVKQYGN